MSEHDGEDEYYYEDAYDDDDDEYTPDDLTYDASRIPPVDHMFLRADVPLRHIVSASDKHCYVWQLLIHPAQHSETVSFSIVNGGKTIDNEVPPNEINDDILLLMLEVLIGSLFVVRAWASTGAAYARIGYPKKTTTVVHIDPKVLTDLLLTVVKEVQRRSHLVIPTGIQHIYSMLIADEFDL